MTTARKVCYMDTETTGTNPDKHGLIQLAMIIEIDGDPVGERAWRLRPFEADVIDPRALEINQTSPEELTAWPDPKTVHLDIVRFLGTYVDKFAPADKLIAAGYNVGFDLDFLSAFFRKCDDPFLGSFFNWRRVDPMYLLHWMAYAGKISLSDYKLTTACRHFGIPLPDAHDALADIRATRQLILTLSDQVEFTEFVPCNTKG